MAATHLKACRQIPGIRVVALCNPSGRHLDGDFSGVQGNVGSEDAVRLDMNAIGAYRDVDAFLRHPGLDLVDICSPTLAHADQSLRALAAGKHVLCEKPVARTSQEARRVAEAARESGRCYMPAMCLRFWPEWAWLKEAVQSGRYGRVLAARFRRVAQPPGWGHGHFHDGKKSGGALLDLHIHDVDFVHHCFGMPTRVSAQGYSKFSGAIDHVVAQYEVESGAIVHAEGSWAMAPGFGFSMSYTVNFEGATADYDGARAGQTLRVFQEGRETQVPELGGPDGYAGELHHIVEAIRTGGAPTVVTPEDGYRSIRICEAEELSIRTRGPVLL